MKSYLNTESGKVLMVLTHITTLWLTYSIQACVLLLFRGIRVLSVKLEEKREKVKPSHCLPNAVSAGVSSLDVLERFIRSPVNAIAVLLFVVFGDNGLR